MWPSIDLQNQENITVVFQSMIKAKKSKGKYSFGKNIIFEIVSIIFLISINILFALLFIFIFFANFARPFTKFVRTEL